MISIDVIIVNYNNGRFLTQCLESVFSQSYEPKEIIVVDDASNDDSMIILDSYARSGRIRLIKNNANIGVSASRNKAIEFGVSEFITTLDADDYYYDNKKLEAEVAIINSHGVDAIAFSNVLKVSEAGRNKWLISERKKIREGNLFFFITHLNGFIPRDYLVSRKNFYAAGRYDENQNLYEDWDLKIRLAKFCTWHYSASVGTAYRDNPNGLSRAPRRDHILATRYIFLKNCMKKNRFLRFLMFIRFFIYQCIYLRRLAI